MDPQQACQDGLYLIHHIYSSLTNPIIIQARQQMSLNCKLVPFFEEIDLHIDFP